MKKICTFILAAILLLTLAACGGSQGNYEITPMFDRTTENREPELAQYVDYRLHFAPVLAEYREFALYGVIENSNWQHLWGEILPEWPPWPHSELGFAFHDLNGNGIMDLILLTRNYTVLAIFSIADYTPNLLHMHSHWLRGATEIGADGTVFFYFSNVPEEGFFHNFTIYYDGSNILTIEAAEMETVINPVTFATEHFNYVRITPQGERIEITEEEWQAIRYRHWSVRTADAGLTFIPLSDIRDSADSPQQNDRPVSASAAVAMNPISAGSVASFVIQQDGTLQYWGNTTAGQVNNVAAVSAGYVHTMILMTDGSLWAFGNNSSGQLGDGTTTNRNAPVWIMDDVVTVSTGGFNTLAIRSDGSLWGWGNFGGVRGYSPLRMMEDVVAVSTGGGHTFAIRTDGSLWAWGQNNFGQLGDGTTTNREWYDPVRIMDDVVAVSAADAGVHAMAIRSDGSLWAWGNNTFNNIGDMIEARIHSSPVRIMDDVAVVSTGGSNTMVIMTDGSLWGWGLNHVGQLGNGTTTDVHSPVWIMDNVIAVSNGFFHTLALTGDGSLWAWGANGASQLGDGTIIPRHEPVHIMDGVKLP